MPIKLYRIYATFYILAFVKRYSMKIITALGTFFLLVSCNKNLESTEEQGLETVAVEVRASADKPLIDDRNDELFHIRRYLVAQLPKLYVEQNPREVKKMQEYKIIKGENMSLDDCAKLIIRADNVVEKAMMRIIKDNLSFDYVKANLKKFVPDEIASRRSTQAALNDLLKERPSHPDSLAE